MWILQFYFLAPPNLGYRLNQWSAVWSESRLCLQCPLFTCKLTRSERAWTRGFTLPNVRFSFGQRYILVLMDLSQVFSLQYSSILRWMKLLGCMVEFERVVRKGGHIFHRTGRNAVCGCSDPLHHSLLNGPRRDATGGCSRESATATRVYTSYTSMNAAAWCLAQMHGAQPGHQLICYNLNGQINLGAGNCTLCVCVSIYL